MADYVVAHFHNAAEGRDEALAQAIDGAHADRVAALTGFTRLQRFRLAPNQLMAIAQPWTYLSIYEFTLDEPALHLPALASPIAGLRDAGLIAADDTERLYTYEMRSRWAFSENHRPGEPFSHLMILLANVTPGRDAEYHRWYDEQHSLEVTGTPGFVGMKRGALAEVQVPPVRYCPGSQVIMGALQTGDLPAALAEFVARANGKSPSGVAWGDRSTAASTARTVHLFESVNGPFGSVD